MIAAIKAGHPALDTKITMFPNLAHEWNILYFSFYRHGWQIDGTNAAKVDPAYAPFDQDFYNWLLQVRHP